jgi:hypothetical protein
VLALAQDEVIGFITSSRPDMAAFEAAVAKQSSMGVLDS